MDGTLSDGANWWGLAAFALLVAGFGLAFFFLTILPQRRNATGLRALSQRRGWRIEKASGSVLKGQGSTLYTDVHPKDDAGWRCRITFFANGNRQIRSTEFADPTLPAPGGMIVIGPQLEPDAARIARQFLGQMAGPLGSLAMRALLGDQLDGVEELRPVEGLAGETVLATAGMDAAAVQQRVTALIRQFCATYPDEKSFPILIWGAQGCRVRLRDDASQPAKLEAFVDHALAVCAALRQPPA